MQCRVARQAEAYGARLQRVVAARGAVEQRLHKRLDLLDGYARVVNMIEIEARCPVLAVGHAGAKCWLLKANGSVFVSSSCLLIHVGSHFYG